MRRFAWVLAAFSLAAPGIEFSDEAARRGLNFQLRNGATGALHQPELMLSGVAALDYNNDGCMDVFFVNGAESPSLRKAGPEHWNRLYRNRCDGTFEDVTARAGVAGSGYGMAAATADYDGDGFTDLFVAGVWRNTLYRNLGDGRFANATAPAGLAVSLPDGRPGWGISAGFLDYNLDGKPDLFVSNYVEWSPAKEPACGPEGRRIYCHPSMYAPLPNQLFRNRGDGTFEDVSRKSGIAAHAGKGMGLAVADFDGDGDPDIFVANDSMRSFLFRNNGDGTFTETGLQAGVALRDDGRTIAGMGADAADFDGDGRLDLVVAGMVNDTFLLHRGIGPGLVFEEAASRTGLARWSKPLTGWSLGFGDFDNDSWPDLIAALAHFPRLEPYLGLPPALPVKLFRNLGGRRFEEGFNISAPGLHRGHALLDADNDGRLDIVVSAIDGPSRLLMNRTRNAGHWIALKNVPLGARVEVLLPDGRKLVRESTTVSGYGSASEPLVRFGLGAAGTVRSIEITLTGSPGISLKPQQVDRVVDVRRP